MIRHTQQQNMYISNIQLHFCQLPPKQTRPTHATTLGVYKGKGKGKGHPITGHEGPEGE